MKPEEELIIAIHKLVQGYRNLKQISAPSFEDYHELVRLVAAVEEVWRKHPIIARAAETVRKN